MRLSKLPKGAQGRSASAKSRRSSVISKVQKRNKWYVYCIRSESSGKELHTYRMHAKSEISDISYIIYLHSTAYESVILPKENAT